MLAGFFNILILMGALQGFIISSLLFFSRKGVLANKLLAAFISLIALACFNLFLANHQWPPNSSMPTIIAMIPMVIIMPMGPLLFFYTKASLNSAFSLAKKDKWHFATTVIDLLPYLFANIFIAGLLLGLLKNSEINGAGLFIDNYNTYADIPRWLSLTIYLVLSRRHLAAVGKTNKVQSVPKQIKWLKELTTAFIVFQAIWLAYLIPYVIPAYSNKLLDLVNWYPLYVPMSLLIYWLGIKGYLVMQAQPLVEKKTSTLLPAAESAKIISVLKEAMESDNLYLNPELNLALLARHTALPQKTISAVLNQHQRQNFNDFVNEYRINAFKQKVCADEVKHLTIAGVAAECGFNSQATFQRAFKQFTGLSPSEFKLQVIAGA